MALPERLFMSLGVPVPPVVENTETSRPLAQDNGVRLYELFDVQFDPSTLATGDTIVYNGTSNKFEVVAEPATAVGFVSVDGVPGVGDDIADGYAPGTIWYNTDAAGGPAVPELYILVDNTAGAAVWVQITLT